MVLCTLLHACEISHNSWEKPEKHEYFSDNFMLNLQITQKLLASTWQHCYVHTQNDNLFLRLALFIVKYSKSTLMYTVIRWKPESHFNIKTITLGMGIPTKWLNGIIFIMGVLTMVRWHLQIEKAPEFDKSVRCKHDKHIGIACHTSMF